VTVTANGVTASGTTLASGGTITWVNSDNRVHDMSSDPHPQHSDCPAVTSGDLNPGQQRTVGPITSVRTCGFHDHLNPGSTTLQGRITVQ
jgi:plastocyanin